MRCRIRYITMVTKVTEAIDYTLVFFSTFEVLKLPIKGPMEDAGVIKLYEPSPTWTPCLYVADVQNMVGRVPLMPLFLAGNSTPTIPHIFSKRKDSGFPYGCADAAATDGRRGSTSGLRTVSISGMSDIFSILTYSRYIPGVYLHAKSYDFIGFNARIHSICRAHWYIEACKEER